MELFGWTDKYSVKVQIGFGLAFLAFGVLFAALMVFNVGKGGGGLIVFPILASAAAGMILWRASGRYTGRK